MSNLKGVTQLLLSKENDQERVGIAGQIGLMSNQILNATVSYVGKADYKEAERYIRDFRIFKSSFCECIFEGTRGTWYYL